MSSDASKEFEAIQAVHSALEPLDEEGRSRVMAYIGSLLGVAVKLGGKTATASGSSDEEENGEGNEGGAAAQATKGPQTFSSFAELYDQAGPKSNGEKALVVGYWLQVCQEADTFTAAAANKELMHLGHKVANITDAIDSFKDQKPSLILQLKKSGNSRQARKTYKVSHAGVKRVEEMLGG
jgi:hypothetical protein